MQRWRGLGLGAALVVLLGAGVLTSVLVGLLDPATERRAPRTDASSSVSGSDRESTPSASASAPARARDSVLRFPSVTRTAAQLRSGSADLYVPNAEAAGRAPSRFPLAVLVADPRIDPGQYEQLAHDLGTYGIAVVVSGRAASASVREVGAWAAVLADDPEQYLRDKVAGTVSFVVLAGSAGPPATTRHPTVVLAASKPLSVTDEGTRGPRTSTVVERARLRTIAAVARPTARWLLAHKGDSAARRVIDP